MTWVPTTYNELLPNNAVLAGTDCDGSSIYIGRASYKGDLLPAKVIPKRKIAYVSHSGDEIKIYSYEVLIGTGFSWVPSSNGNVPAHALIAGSTRHGESLYIGRIRYKGSLTPGKVHPSHGCLYFPFGCTERKSLTYEVLVAQQRSEQFSFRGRDVRKPKKKLLRF